MGLERFADRLFYEDDPNYVLYVEKVVDGFIAHVNRQREREKG